MDLVEGPVLAPPHPPATVPRATPGRIDWSRSALAAALSGLGRPDLWPLALVAFLVRGGLVPFVLPIVVLPSTVGVATFVGPTLVTAEGLTPQAVALAIGLAAALAAWYLAGGLLAAWSEARTIEASLRDEAGAEVGAGADAADGDGHRRLVASTLARILTARTVSFLPLAVAAGWGVSRIVSVGYAELVSPADVSIPFPLRVLREVPDVIAVVLVAWLACEAIGGIAVRRMLLLGEPLLPSVVFAAVDLVRRPVTSVLTVLVPLAGAALLVAPSLLAAALAWDRVRVALGGGESIVLAVVLTFLFVAIWGVGMVLAAAAAAWRNVAWTFEVLRVGTPAPTGDEVLAGTGAPMDRRSEPEVVPLHD